MATTPRVFVSHASKDKERFVDGFVARLQAHGINLWYDSWDILPGDDLVHSIFGAIRDASAVIIVLSKVSVAQPWVQDELSASKVQQVTRKARLIPVLIEECEVPPSLAHIRWERITDLNEYEDVLSRIVRAIFEDRSKPLLVPPPVYLSHDRLQHIPGITATDTNLLTRLINTSLEIGQTWVDAVEVRFAGIELGISHDDLRDCLEILEDRGLVKPAWTLGDHIPPVNVTTHGFETYGRFLLPYFNELLSKVLMTTVNEGLRGNGEIAVQLGERPITITYVLDILAEKGFLKVAKFHGDDVNMSSVWEVTALGRRKAAER